MNKPESSFTAEPVLPAESCRAQLGLILGSADFDATGREHRFLSYVVEEALSGRGDRIKAYTIAVEVFGRGQSFDPQTDPIVRIEAGHLRRALERYYLTSGQRDPILITIPKGGYVPSFARQAETELAPLPAPLVAQPVSERPTLWRTRPRVLAAVLMPLVAIVASLSVWWWWAPSTYTEPARPRVLVQTFDNPGGTQAAGVVASGLKEEIVEQLSKFRDLLVMESAPKPEDASLAPPRFVVAGSVTLSDEAFQLRVRLINRGNGSVIWANTYDGPLKVSVFRDAQKEIAHSVSQNLAQVYGVIFQADEDLDVSNAPDDWVAYGCTLSFYAYRLEMDPERRPAVRTCLEKAVDRFPGYASAWGLLSLVYVDDYRYGVDGRPPASALERAFAAARHAAALDPLNMPARQAKMLALYFDRQIDAALALGEESLKLNPNDTEFLSEYGERLAVSGQWTKGCSMIAGARQLNPGTSADYEAVLALCSYFGGDYAQAANWLKKAPSPMNPIYHLIGAAINGEAGNVAEAHRESEWLQQNFPALVKNLRGQVSMRLARPQDVETILGSLRKAGLVIPD
ncbi:hypothetical protein FJV83_28690 [Mesorhizobium sp. WSM4307]|uniref:hypothetical protein n=1 Tax=unclassified Mesorhizobium TaxID=325217 RepID=UPI000BAED2F9|nr:MULTISPECIES: hypothetical protein [unclassified Mesorhizobium]PBC18639.1 hypothetical protein CK226_33770 [Mesorhizobium sp. WSM4311]TRC73373.1 hypothetical protein FJV80_30700 [Mesorhizobium sp. WSM4310]TRC78070.1 hypothetical protein FJV81_10935 [Mesorhizobium sp. WSM4315]TRC79259.1 hypothetical protein FJV83_28690 [Mesorhizobium sp. WSM4307]TRC90905.1 hypothetical protein FJV82_33245 [Mesorhizobium sp. WSM4305]